MKEAFTIVGASFLWLAIAQCASTPIVRAIDSAPTVVGWFVAIATYFILREIRKGRG
jgi:hypothetical protein